MIPLDPVGLDPHTPAQTVQRDRYGRYRIVDPDTGKVASWTRATTVSKTLEDASNLTAWAKRLVAIGVANHPHLAAGIAAAAAVDDKKRLNALCEQALEAAGGTARRELGTALHSLCELVDTGRMTIADVPEAWRDDVTAYREQLEANQLTVVPEYVEAVLLNHTLRIAGTCDRIYRDRDGQLVIGDLKTGSYMSWGAFDTQLAIYATATHLWDPATQTLTPMPAVRQDHAWIVHLPAGEGRCELHAVSVPLGYDNALMALEVRRMRAADKRDRYIVDPYPHTPAPLPAPARTVRHDWTPPTRIDEGPAAPIEQVARFRAAVEHIDPAARDTLQALVRAANDANLPIGISQPTLRRLRINRALVRLARHHGAQLTDDHIRTVVAAVLPEAAQPAVPLHVALGSLDLDEAQRFVEIAVAVAGGTVA